MLGGNLGSLLYGDVSVMAWYCDHCKHAITGVQRLLVRTCNVETNVESLNERVETLENRELVSNDKIRLSV